MYFLSMYVSMLLLNSDNMQIKWQRYDAQALGQTGAPRGFANQTQLISVGILQLGK